MLAIYIIGLAVKRNIDFTKFNSELLQEKFLAGLPSSQNIFNFFTSSKSTPIFLSVFDSFSSRIMVFSIVERSASNNSVSISSISLTGSMLSST